MVRSVTADTVRVGIRQRLVIVWPSFGPYHLARIQSLTAHFDVHAVELAGSQRLYRWAENKSSLGWSIHTLREGAWEDQNSLAVAVRLWRKLNDLRPDLLLVPGYANAPALSAALWGKTHASRTLLMSESNQDDYRRKWWVELGKRALVTCLFDGAVVGGKRAKHYLASLGLAGLNVATGYDVVDNHFFSERTGLIRISGSGREGALTAPYFLYVGRLAPEKNVCSLIQAFGAYRKAGGVWNLMLVGDGPLAADLRSRAAGLACSGAICFAGHKTAAELARYYAYATCFVLPSRREPWGLVVNEAMAAGLPVIVSSRCGCADDLVEPGANGFLIDPEDTDALGRCMREISTMSASALGSMGARSREIIAKYSPAYFASEIYRISAR
jgi:glycosyltransferase involved in cell wall biosynthesis